MQFTSGDLHPAMASRPLTVLTDAAARRGRGRVFCSIVLSLVRSNERKKIMNNPFGVAIVASAVLLTACASPISKQAQHQINAPINCSKAEQDIAILENEKKSVAAQAAAGVSSILPIGLVAGLIKGTAKDKAKVATGEYNNQIKTKISQIKAECGVK